MKNSLTPEQLAKRRKINKKIYTFIGIPAIILWIIILIMPSTPKSVPVEVKINIDSIVNLVKNDKLFEIKEVYYNDKDSSFNIAITNKGNVIVEKDYSTLYFNNTYHIDKFPCFDGVYLYAYKKGKTFQNGDYKEYLMCESKKAGKLIEIFKNNFCVRDIECTAISGFIKKQLNDPDSYKSDKIFVEWLHGDHFLVTNIFRAKNAFGALVLNKCAVEVDAEGNGYSFKFIE